MQKICWNWPKTATRSNEWFGKGSGYKINILKGNCVYILTTIRTRNEKIVLFTTHQEYDTLWDKMDNRCLRLKH